MFSAYSSAVPGIACHFAAPSRTTSSVGAVTSRMSGTGPLARVGLSIGRPSVSTSFAEPPSSRSAGCRASVAVTASPICGGAIASGFQGPARLGAASQPSKRRR